MILSQAKAQTANRTVDSLQQLLQTAQQQKNWKRTIEIQNELGDYYSNKPDFDELARFHFQNSMQIASKHQDALAYGRSANSMGELFFNAANFDSTIHYFLAAQKAFKNISTYEYAHTFSSIGNLYFTFNAYKSALNYYKKSLYLKQQNVKDRWSIPYAYWCIAEAHYAMGQSDSAFYYYKRSSDEAVETRGIPYYGNEGLAQLLIDREEYDSALVVLQPVVTWYLDADVSSWIADLGLLYMRIYLEKNSDANFEKWTNVVRHEALGSFLPEQRRRFYELMSEFHLRKNQLDSALYYQQKTTEQWEAISKAQGNSNIDEVIAAFEALKFQSDLQKKEMEKEAQEIENRRLSENNYLFSWVVFLLAILLVLLGFILFILNRQRNRMKERNASIESANAEISGQLKKKDETLSNVHQKIALSHLKLEMKQKMLKELDTRLDRNDRLAHSGEINEVKRRIKQEKHADRHWDEFLHHFDAANSAFFRKLKQKHQQLTTNDQKHCAFLLLRLSNKEVGVITGVTPDSVKKARQRLKKKLHLGSNDSLTDYLDCILPNETVKTP
ncbi:MAG: hypothetical protein Crog4KO_26630 [Crocinitomicaceae bacterium]